MACLFPSQIKNPKYDYLYKYNKSIEPQLIVPCGKCMPCRETRQAQLEFLCKKELVDVYLSGRGASFVTLTYNDYNVPHNSVGRQTLRKTDLQKFMKNFRRRLEYYKINVPFKFVACGELGDKFSRPHYHIVFLGLSDILVSSIIRKVWHFGNVQIGPLAPGGLRYVLKYITKTHPDKEVKFIRKIAMVENPFLIHSQRIGKDWIIKNTHLIAANNYQFNLNGKIQFFPSYVCKYVYAHTGIPYSKLKQESMYKSINFIKYCNDKGIDLDKTPVKDAYQVFSSEDTYIKYKQKVAVLRAKNKPVNDDTLKINYKRVPVINLQPTYSKYFRSEISNLASQAILALTA